VERQAAVSDCGILVVQAFLPVAKKEFPFIAEVDRFGSGFVGGLV
jgi:hypothetical protein